MKVLSINLGNYSSTGGIARGIKCAAIRDGMEYAFAYPIDVYNKAVEEDDWIIGNKFGRKSSVAMGMITGLNGCFSIFATLKLLHKIKCFNPHIIHFHNLHNNYINLPLLFWYVKKYKIRIVWTLHDCWSFTGQCPYFSSSKCDKWKTGCYNCPSFHDYPKAYVDNTKLMWKLKKRWFSNLQNLTIVTPSLWLASLVKQSFLNNYPTCIINNGIDLNIFRPTHGDFREKYKLNNKFVVLGVAFDWGTRKGLDVFIELSQLLSTQYQIVLVGTNENIDRSLPENIISISRTQNQSELAEIYSSANVFVNPTREENYPTVNMEALACGTPVLTFDTGGSPEIVDDTCGSVVDCGDIDALEREIIRICENEPYSVEACLKRAESFDMNERFQEYVELYKEIANDGIATSRI